MAAKVTQDEEKKKQTYFFPILPWGMGGDGGFSFALVCVH